MNLNELSKRMNSTIMANCPFKTIRDLRWIKRKLTELRIKLRLSIRDLIQIVLKLEVYINKTYLKMKLVWFKNEFNSIILDFEKRQHLCQTVKTTDRFQRRGRLENQKLSLVSRHRFFLILIINKKLSELQNHSIMN